MALFPTDAKDGQLLEADNGVYYVYNKEKNAWQSNNVIPKWSDQVFIRGVENQTQQNVNDINKAANTKVGSIAAGTSQLVEVAFDVKTRGIWKHQSGAVAPGDPPVGLQCFLVEDSEGGKTQQYGEAAVLVIHAIGGGEKDKIAIGSTEIDDLITIQNQNDLQGGSYIVTGIEEFNSDNPDELTDAYARYTVRVNEKATTGGFSADEIVTIRIFPRATEGAGVEDFDDRYLQLTGGSITGQLSVSGNFSAQGDVLFPLARDKAFRVYDLQGGQVFSVYGDIFGAGAMYYGAIEQGKHVVTKEYVDSSTEELLPLSGGSMKGDIAMNGHQVTGLGTPKKDGQACTKGYVDEQIAGIEIPEIPDFELSTKDKMYLKGYYPFVINNNSQPEPGEITFKDYNYIVTQDPEKWKHVEYSAVSDAYGNGLEQQFMNHFDTRDLSEHRAQVWLCREDGQKFASWVGPIKLADNNFESRSSMTIENDAKMVGSKHYDLTTLRVDYGDILWIKCSYWG